jgi:hypothetical protein
MRAEAELTDEAPKAHSLVYDADKLVASGENLAKAREEFENAWKLYAVVFEKYPSLMENAEAQDLIESVGHYRDLLGQLDEPFPSSFPLWDLLDKHQKGQQIRDQVKLLQGADAAGGKKEETPSEPPKVDEANQRATRRRPTSQKSTTTSRDQIWSRCAASDGSNVAYRPSRFMSMRCGSSCS